MTERAELVKARSMLVLLLATCDQTLLALQAAGNVLDTDLTDLLSAMIDRSETELVSLKARIEAVSPLSQGRLHDFITPPSARGFRDGDRQATRGTEEGVDGSSPSEASRILQISQMRCPNGRG